MKLKILIILSLLALLIGSGRFGTLIQTNWLNASAASQQKDPFYLMAHESLGFLRDGLPAKEVIKNLGEPGRKSAKIVWGADGLEHQTWYYQTKGIELDIANEVKRQTLRTVNMITIRKPCTYRTKRNIGIGSSKNDLLKVYRNEIDHKASQGNIIIAGSVYGGVFFTLEKNQVSKIFIGAGAE